MSKRRKQKKLDRANKFIELVDRHEPEEDKVVRALGENESPRDDLKMRARNQMVRPWSGWSLNEYMFRREAMYGNTLYVSSYHRDLLSSFITLENQPSGLKGLIPNLEVYDEPEGWDNGGDGEVGLSDELLAGTPWGKDGDAEGPRARGVWMDVPGVRFSWEGGE